MLTLVGLLLFEVVKLFACIAFAIVMLRVLFSKPDGLEWTRRPYFALIISTGPVPWQTRTQTRTLAGALAWLLWQSVTHRRTWDSLRIRQLDREAWKARCFRPRGEDPAVPFLLSDADQISMWDGQ